jgi:hypothetical protein
MKKCCDSFYSVKQEPLFPSLVKKVTPGKDDVCFSFPVHRHCCLWSSDRFLLSLGPFCSRDVFLGKRNCRGELGRINK